MHFVVFLTASVLATRVSALPLNINLGAYSPALVVGDGEISFGSKTDVSNLMNALEGAAVTAANGATAQAAAKSVVEPSTEAVVATSPTGTLTPTTSEPPAVEETGSATAIQGLGKSATPIEEHKLISRDLAGFDRALKYAADALKTSPKIELGTGAKGSGVGILQEAGTSAGVATAAKIITSDLAARGVEAKMKQTVTTMYIRRGLPPADSVDVAASRSFDTPTIAQREAAPLPIQEGVNLNLAEGQEVSLTFVETREADDNE